MTTHAEILCPRGLKPAARPAPLPHGRGSVWSARSPRRGSVLVLVMTLLGILFVLGVAFLATMNFEAGMIASQRQRDRSDRGVHATVVDMGAMLRDTLMAAPDRPFGDTSVALTSSAYAEMPGIQNSFSPIEPYWTIDAGVDGIPGTSDDVSVLVFGSYFDAKALRNRPFSGPSIHPGFTINTAFPSGAQIPGFLVSVPGGAAGVRLLRCSDGPLRGQLCQFNDDCRPDVVNDPPYLCEGPRVADADGDGIVESVLVDAADIGLTGTPLADLSAAVNPPSNPTGRVSVALRVVPHGGMVNLNDSHPNLIENVLGVPTGTLENPDPNVVGPSFFHRPTQTQTLYSPQLEESLLRRRALLPPAEIPSSALEGNSIVSATGSPTGAADMAWFLYPPMWPGGAIAGSYESVFNHRYAPFAPGEAFPGNVNYELWAVRMEPFTAQSVYGKVAAYEPEYDRRHLVTTISHDDLFSRGGTIDMGSGAEDIRQAMIEANQAAWNPNACPNVLPFEYVEYPTDLPLETDSRLVADPRYETCEVNGVMCSTSVFCRFDPRKGRMQLSLPWIDDELARANNFTDARERENARQRVFHTIHDAFFMLVRNAATPLEVEGMPCNNDEDCPVRDTVCSPNTSVCVHGGNPLVNSFDGCRGVGDCAIPGSDCTDLTCRGGARNGFSCVVDSDCPGGACRGICELVAPAWQEQRCANDANCGRSDEFCLPNGYCADRWTRQKRSEALISRTAASLTANMIDYVDSDNVPTRVAIRDFEFGVKKCEADARQNLTCSTDSDCPGGRGCKVLTGRDIDTDPPAGMGCTSDSDCSIGLICSGTTGQCIRPTFVYGLERQPYISEVTTLANSDPPRQLDGWAVEILNPNPVAISASDPGNNEEYFIYEVDPGGTLASAHVVRLSNSVFQGIVGSPGVPFTTYYSLKPPGTIQELFGDPLVGTPNLLDSTNAFTFMNDWTLYLVRRMQFPGDANPTDIVVDQFRVTGDGLDLIGKEAGDLALADPSVPFRFSVGRVIRDLATMWTGTVPVTHESGQNAATLGTWNIDIVDNEIHPVEIQFANTGTFGPHIGNSSAVAAFPTTGSMSLLMRYANRAITDFAPPPIGTTVGKVTDLAFTTALTRSTNVEALVEDPPGTGIFQKPTADIKAEEQIDNGRMPLFDVGVVASNPRAGKQSAEHFPPQLLKAWNPDPTVNDPSRSHRPLPGDLNMLPWGQLVFDYFTALPLSGAGPYLVPDLNGDGNPDYPIGAPESQPRVDRDGARVHGRINLNAAPWTVLAGLPFVPMNRIPAPFVDRIEQRIYGSPPPIARSEAGFISDSLAQAIIAYRDARPLPGSGTGNLTGNYNDGSPAVGVSITPATTFARGWTSDTPMSRRGTGFMSVGELANVRHPGAFNNSYKIDSGVIGSQANKNTENFVDAAAVLIALGDWATIRSQVFTVYGVIRGEPDANATDPVADVDSRAIRFQETVDRLPTFFGEPRPRRIGAGTVSKFTDVNND